MFYQLQTRNITKSVEEKFTITRKGVKSTHVPAEG